MASPIISVEDLSKRYVLRHQQDKPGYHTLRDVMSERVGRVLRGGAPRTTLEEFNALTDVSFEVGAGDRLGIIGRNGAGKSTLLKILSRIVAPTKGRITIDGRVASLLEVGTGFHPELSGRENIFLNGAILGMSRSEIKASFDEIVAFAEVERFIDTPVKRYSSGMYVRLAFAVAAHLDPEILIVDEVLAVGDVEFQRKCLGKMEQVSGSGRTILFVSHNMGAIRRLCRRCILLDRGHLKAEGPTDQVLPLYFGLEKRTLLDGLSISATPLHPAGEWISGSDVRVEITWNKGRFPAGWHADVACYTLEGIKLFALQSHTIQGFDSTDPLMNGIRFEITNPGLIDRDIRLDVGIRPGAYQPYDLVVENALLLSPSGKVRDENRVMDVIIVPEATCTAIRT